MIGNTKQEKVIRKGNNEDTKELKQIKTNNFPSLLNLIFSLGLLLLLLFLLMMLFLFLLSFLFVLLMKGNIKSNQNKMWRGLCE